MKGPGLVTIRHAPVARAWRGTCYGVSDVPTEVTAARAADAMETALGAGEPSFDVVWSSDLGRCAGPAAELAARGRAADHREDVRLRGAITAPSREGRGRLTIRDRGARSLGLQLGDGGASGGRVGTRARAKGRGLGLRAGPGESSPAGRAGVQRSLLVSTGEVDWPRAMQLDLPHLTLRGVELAALGTSGARSRDSKSRCGEMRTGLEPMPGACLSGTRALLEAGDLSETSRRWRR